MQNIQIKKTHIREDLKYLQPFGAVMYLFISLVLHSNCIGTRYVFPLVL